MSCSPPCNGMGAALCLSHACRRRAGSYQNWLDSAFVDCSTAFFGCPPVETFINLTGSWPQASPPAPSDTVLELTGDWLQPILSQAHHGYFQVGRAGHRVYASPKTLGDQVIFKQ